MVIKEIKRLLVTYFSEIYDNLKLLGFIEDINRNLSSSGDSTDHNVVIIHIPKNIVHKGQSNVEIFHKSAGIKVIIFDDRAAQAVVLDDEEHNGEDSTEIV